MQPTRRTWTITAIGVTLAVAAPVIASPIPAAGAAMVFAWVLSQQFITVRQFQATVDTTTVSVSSAVSTVQVETDVPVTVTVERPASAAETNQTVTLNLPVAAKYIPEEDRQVSLLIGETQASTTVLVSFTTAGRMTFPKPEWQLTSNGQTFTETVSRGETPTIDVEAETMEEIYIGRGGSEVSAFGQYDTDETGEGLTPAELREYISGEAADRIDWKATARLPDTYVREFEAQIDREINLIVDHRSQTASESDPHSQFSYLREVALSILANAEATGEAIGLLTVGDEGLTTVTTPTQNQLDYARIREELLSLRPTPTTQPESPVDFSHPETPQRLTQELNNDSSKFETVLQRFAETAPSYRKRFESHPLYGAIEYLQSASLTGQLTIILTTDAERQQLRRIVREAASGNGAVIMFITPQVLFETDQLANLETVYTEYKSFEEFRTQLERNASVVVYEVAPGERLAKLLASQQGKKTTQQAGGNHE